MLARDSVGVPVLARPADADAKRNLAALCRAPGSLDSAQVVEVPLARDSSTKATFGLFLFGPRPSALFCVSVNDREMVRESYPSLRNPSDLNPGSLRDTAARAALERRHADTYARNFFRPGSFRFFPGQPLDWEEGAEPWMGSDFGDSSPKPALLRELADEGADSAGVDSLVDELSEAGVLTFNYAPRGNYEATEVLVWVPSRRQFVPIEWGS